MDLIEALRLTPAPGAPEVVALVGGGGKSSTAFRLAAEAAARGVRAVATTTTRIAASEIDAAPAVVEVTSVAVTGAALPLAQLDAALARSGWCLLVDAARGEKRSGITPAQVDGLLAMAPQLGLGLIAVEADGSRQLPIKAPAAHEPALPSCATLVVAVAGVDALGRDLTPDQVHRPERIRALLGLPPAAPVRLTPAQMARLLLDTQGGDRGRPPGARRMVLINKVEDAAQLALARLVAARAVAAGVTALIAAVGRADTAPVRERWGPLGVVVLAAGQARRMGKPKQLIAVDGMTMVRRGVTTALAAGAQQVILVSGAHAAAVEAEVAPLAAGRAELEIAHNPAWASGQASSLQAGLAALRPEMEAAIFLPVDQPFVPPALLRRLAQGWRSGAPLAAPVVEGALHGAPVVEGALHGAPGANGTLRGAPAIFDRSLWPELMAVRGDVGGREVLRRHAATAHAVPAQAAWLRDLDTPDDLAG